MGLELGIVGLPNVGKSTLFSALTAQKVDAQNYPFCTIEPNVAVVKVPDARLDFLHHTFNAESIIHNTLKIIDIAGLVRGASKGDGLGNKFLANIRQVDAILEVVRCFNDKNIIHVDEVIDPLRDIETIHTELILADMDMVTRFIEKETKLLKADPRKKEGLIFLNSLLKHLNNGGWANSLEVDEEHLAIYKQLSLLTDKPACVVMNTDHDDYDNKHCQLVKQAAAKLNFEHLLISAKLEAEIAEFEGEEKSAMLAEMGLTKSGLDGVIETGFNLLDQIVFYTAGKKEVRAWNVKKDSSLPQAAGKIHSDMERGFIKGEVYNVADLKHYKTEAEVKKAGKVQLEGKNYKIQDGDVINIKFAV